MVSIRKLEIFLAVCNEGSMSKASQKLYISQPAISCALKELESTYNVRLFNRISHTLLLTREGTVLRNYAQQIIGLTEKLDGLFRETVTTPTLKLGCSIHFGLTALTPLINQFNTVRSEEKVYCQAVIKESRDLIADVLTTELDMAVVEYSNPNMLPVPLVGLILSEDHLSVICPAGSPLAQKERVPLSDLAREDFVMRESSSDNRRTIDNVLKKYGVSLHVIWESTSAHVLMNAVENNIGCSILSETVVMNNSKSGRIAFVKTDIIPEFKRYIILIYRADRELTREMTDFINIAKSGDFV